MRLKKRPWGDKVLSSNLDIVLTESGLDSERFLSFIDCDLLSLEIGAGKGDFVIQMAKKYPNMRFLAIEMQSMALAYAVRKIQDEKLENILFINADGNILLDHIKDKTITTVFLNHSDPWPKKRHHKRRLTYPTMLAKYDRVLKDDGKLIFKTDNDVLFTDSIEYINESNFKLESVNYDYDGLDPYDAKTEYETRFREIGTPIKRYIAVKK
jgi:tRNA (guanine-N7-)-methyltransferase